MAKKKKYLKDRDLKNPTYNKHEMEIMDSLSNLQQTITLMAKSGFTTYNLIKFIDAYNETNILGAKYLCSELKIPTEPIEESYERMWQKHNG